MLPKEYASRTKATRNSPTQRVSFELEFILVKAGSLPAQLDDAKDYNDHHVVDDDDGDDEYA